MYLNFQTKVQTSYQMYFNKKKFYHKINDCYQRIKLKAHFKDYTNKSKTEEDTFRKPTDKT